MSDNKQLGEHPVTSVEVPFEVVLRFTVPYDLEDESEVEHYYAKYGALVICKTDGTEERYETVTDCARECDLKHPSDHIVTETFSPNEIAAYKPPTSHWRPIDRLLNKGLKLSKLRTF